MYLRKLLWVKFIDDVLQCMSVDNRAVESFLNNYIFILIVLVLAIDDLLHLIDFLYLLNLSFSGVIKLIFIIVSFLEVHLELS